MSLLVSAATRLLTSRRLDGRWSVVVVAVCAKNLVTVGEEAGAHQGHGAARTLEARLVPLSVLKRNVLPISET